MEIISFDIGCGGRLQLVVLLFLFTLLPREQMKKKMLLQRGRGPTSSLAGVVATFGIAVSPKLLPSFP